MSRTTGSVVGRSQERRTSARLVVGRRVHSHAQKESDNDGGLEEGITIVEGVNW